MLYAVLVTIEAKGGRGENALLFCGTQVSQRYLRVAPNAFCKRRRTQKSSTAHRIRSEGSTRYCGSQGSKSRYAAIASVRSVLKHFAEYASFREKDSGERRPPIGTPANGGLHSPEQFKTAARSAAGPGGDASHGHSCTATHLAHPFLQGRCSATSAAAAGPWTGKRRDLRSALEQLLKRASTDAASCNSHASKFERSRPIAPRPSLLNWIRKRNSEIKNTGGRNSEIKKNKVGNSEINSVPLLCITKTGRTEGGA